MTLQVNFPTIESAVPYKDPNVLARSLDHPKTRYLSGVFDSKGIWPSSAEEYEPR